MNEFSLLLKQLNEKLNLPQPVKSRILLEVGADLADAAEYFRNQGMSEKAAQQKAIEKFSLEDAGIDALVELHRSRLQRFLDNVSLQARTRWEKTLLLLILLMIAVFSVRAIVTTPFLQNTNQFLWWTIGNCLAGLGLGLAKFYQLYVKKAHYIRTLRNGLPALLFLSGMNLTGGVLGHFTELFFAKEHALLRSTKLIYLFNVNSSETLQQVMFLTNAMIRNSATTMVCLLGTIFLAFVWFVLENKVLRIQQAELNALNFFSK